MIDYASESTEKLSALRDRMSEQLRMAPGGSRLDEARREALEEELAEIEYELTERESGIYTVACSGGCGKVIDLPQPHGVYVCHRCQMMSRA